LEILEESITRGTEYDIDVKVLVKNQGILRLVLVEVEDNTENEGEDKEC
jgi:hypothetical protein